MDHAPAAVAEPDHRVQFYQDDRHLIATVARFVGGGLLAGDGAVVIATGEHRSALRTALAAQGIAVDAATARGQLVLADARATLDRLLVDGRPDAGRFHQVVVALVERLTARYPRVRAYGEMVDLLCGDGERDAMMELERMWARLLAVKPIGLLCGYRLDRFHRTADAADFHRVCDAHGHVSPADDWTGAEAEAQRRVIAGLQQQAVALRGEIAERQRVERELRASEARSRRHAAALEKAVAELERFAYVCAHDLREPMRMITQYLGLFTHRYGSDLASEGRRFIGFAEQGAVRMGELIDALLRHAAAGDRAEARVVDADALLGEVLRELAPAIAAADARVRRDRLPVVHGDATGLRQVFTNLIDNGLKFRGDRPAEIAIAVDDGTSEWTFTVADRGIGIRPEDHARIFDVLQRLHGRDVPGTGIGLAICKRIVEVHGGRLWVESAAGAGASFRFTLPKPGSAAFAAM